MKYGIEFEFFVSKDGKIIPAYEATDNLDGNPFLGEVKTKPFDNILDCIFSLEKKIYVEKAKLEEKGYKMEILPIHRFSKEDLVNFRKNKKAVDKKDFEELEEFSIYPDGKLGNLLNRGEVKASLQINFSEHKSISYTKFSKITVEDKYRYDSSVETKEYSCLFNYISIIQKLDKFYKEDISKTSRTKGVYTIKPGEFGDRIEYRSLPNIIDYKQLISLLQ